MATITTTVALLAATVLGRVSGTEFRDGVGRPDGRPALEASAAATVDRAVLNAGTPRLAEEGVAYRFRVAYTDPMGGELRTPAAWSATVYLHAAGGGSPRPIARLSDVVPSISIPRPLGVALHAGDSLSVVAELRGHGARVMVRLRLAIDLEPPMLARTRLAIAPTAMTRVAGDDTAWEIEAPATGRLLAIAALGEPGALALDDVTTATRLWERGSREVLGDAAGETARLGVPVVRGHVYRLSVTRGTAAAPASEPVALLLAGR